MTNSFWSAASPGWSPAPVMSGGERSAEGGQWCDPALRQLAARTKAPNQRLNCACDCYRAEHFTEDLHG